MNEIKQFSFTALSNGNASQLYGRLKSPLASIIAADTPAGDARDAARILAAPKINAFFEVAAELDSVLRQAVGSAITRDLDALDAERDAALALVNGAIDRALRSQRDAVHAAANRIDVIRDLYPRLANRQRDEQTRLTESLLSDLAAPAIASDIERVPGLSALLDNLSDLNAEFAQSFNARVDERAEVVAGRTRAVRRRADSAVSAAMSAVNLIASTCEADFLATAIATINGVLDQARLDLSARRRGRGLKKGTGDLGLGTGEGSL